MSKLLITLVAATMASFGFTAAQAAGTTATASAPALSHDQAKDAKTQADAQYKAKKDQADASEKLNKANCDTAHNSTHGEKSACKDVAEAQAKKQKADAKLQKETDDANIKANSK
jgi:hypothetical protein